MTTWFVYALTRLLYGVQAGFWAAVAANVAPVIGWTSGTWVLPDGPLYAALTGGAYAVARVLFVSRGNPLGGFGLASPAAWRCFRSCTVFFSSRACWSFLLRARATGAGLRRRGHTPAPSWRSFCSHRLVWNAQHDWIAITFKAQRGEARQFSIGAFLALLGGQMVFLLPLVWIALIAVWVKAVRTGPVAVRDWLIVCLASGPIVVFTIIGLWAHRVLPHWAMPGYLLLMPLLGREIARGLALSQRWVKPWLWLNVGTTGALVPAIIAIALLPWPAIAPFGRPLPDPLIETVSWRPAASELRGRGLLSGRVSSLWAPTGMKRPNWTPRWAAL